MGAARSWFYYAVELPVKRGDRSLEDASLTYLLRWHRRPLAQAAFHGWMEEEETWFPQQPA